MKINSFEDLAELLTAAKKDKAKQTITPSPATDYSVDISSKERKALHKEELRRAKAEYKRSCMKSREIIEYPTIENIEDETDNSLQDALSLTEDSVLPVIHRKKTISEAEIDSELANLINTAESVEQFNTICRKFRELLNEDEIIAYYDIACKRALENFIVSMPPTKEHKKHKINKKKGAAILCNGMTTIERHKLNGDKSIRKGYSSTGVKLPSRLELEQYHDKREEERERHAKFVRENPDRKRHGKMIIYIASGGQNKQY